MILDTTFLVDVLRKDRGALQRARDLEERGEPARIPTAVAFELWEGTERSTHPAKEQERVGDFLQRYPLLELSRRHAARAGRLAGRMERRGVALGDIDALIAGTALEEGEALLTRNVGDFERIPDLRVETY